MAISWGAYEGHIRVGIEVTWADAGGGSIDNATTTARATVKIYTGVDDVFDFYDDQLLTHSGSISGTTSFHNSQGSSTSILRATKTYNYTYADDEYGSSPGTRTFKSSLSGVFNGATPSKSVTSSIPARPIATPSPPTSPALTRVSDTSTTVSWVRHASYARPYKTMTLQVNTWNSGASSWGSWSTASNPAGSVSSASFTSAANKKYAVQVRANNDAGSSAWAGGTSLIIYTSPLIPTAPSIAPSGDGQRVSWANTGMGYSEYVTEIIGYKNGTSVGVLASVSSGTTIWDHLTTTGTTHYSSGDRWKYTVRHRTSSTVSGSYLYSAETAFTSETGGVTVPPLQPTSLSPNGGKFDPTTDTVFSWRHNPGTDKAAQTAFKFYHRSAAVGGAYAEVDVISGSSSYTMPGNTYGSGIDVEWYVETKGADATYSPSSDVATMRFETLIQYPVFMNGNDSELEAASSLPHLDMFRSTTTGAATIPSATFTSYSYPEVRISRGFTISGSVLTVEYPGVYQINASVGFAADPDGRRIIQVYVNGVALFRGTTLGIDSATAQVDVSKAIQLETGDEVEVKIWHNAGADLDTSTTVTENFFDMTWVAPRY